MKLMKYVTSFDYVLFLSVILLTVLGILFINSANFNKTGEYQSQWIRQMVFAIASLILCISLLFINSKNIKGISLWIYVACMVFLIITLLFGKTVKGQLRLSIFGISLQFSEFMKIAFILLLSNYYASRSRQDMRKITTFLVGLAITGGPILLIILQPDLGTMLVYFPIFIAVSFMAGVKKRYCLYTIALFFTISLIPVLSTVNKLFYNSENDIINLVMNTRYMILVFIILGITIGLSSLTYFNIIKVSELFRKIMYWYLFASTILCFGLLISYPADRVVLKEYQKDRLLIFFNPSYDEEGKGYNIIQSKTAIGNGGLFGHGWRRGKQIQNRFLPEQATDFIYPVIAEELGFLGSLIILILYSLLFVRGFFIMLKSKVLWNTYVVMGILTMLLFHIFQNMGMTLGIMPITGIPLPYLSYGGSFLITCYIALGLLLNFNMSRYQY
jgi:rod shape determining protein RodA